MFKRNKYEIGQTIFEGKFSFIKIASLKKKDIAAVTKVTENKKVKDKKFLTPYREILLHVSLNHENLLKVSNYGIIGDSSYFITYNYARKNLMEISAGKPLQSRKMKLYFYQLIKALRYLHSNNLAHCALELENLLITKDDNLLVTGFSQVRMFKYGNYKFPCNEQYGLLPYMAPEVYQCREHCPARAEIWTLGIILLHLAKGKFVWKMPDENDLEYKKWLTEGFKHSKISRKFSLNKISTINLMLKVNPEERILLEDLEGIDWLNKLHIGSQSTGSLSFSSQLK